MLIKLGYPNFLHGCDFLCFNLMNINEFENSGSSPLPVFSLLVSTATRSWLTVGILSPPILKGAEDSVAYNVMHVVMHIDY